MRLEFISQDKYLETAMKELYSFDVNCTYVLKVSYKSGIICNSNQNADKKVLSSFPSSYIRLDLNKDTKSIYNYYKDLKHPITKEDLEEAFNSLFQCIM